MFFFFNGKSTNCFSRIFFPTDLSTCFLACFSQKLNMFKNVIGLIQNHIFLIVSSFTTYFYPKNSATDERAPLNPILWHECMRAQSCLTLATPWTAACQALSVEFSRQEYCSGLPFPSPRGLPKPGFKPCISPVFPELPGGFFTTEPPGSPTLWKKKETIVKEGCQIFFFPFKSFPQRTLV